MTGPIVRRGVLAVSGALWWWAVLAVLGLLWWWAVLRLALASDAGALEGTVAAGGWGLSLLPVHCVAKARAAGAVRRGRWRQAWRGGRGGAGETGGGCGAGSGGCGGRVCGGCGEGAG
ncbi:hypothetical protein ACIQOU_36105 [Streptomyces sp. NPDC091279]|uniref:hypothetical protein n=1 Tax=Streptomyces sp. NPDC091279 TaxID=3365983 RepID=UPI0037F117C6